MVVGCQPYAPAAFTPRNIPGTHFHYGLSRKEMSLKNPVTTPGIDPGTVRLVAQRLNHYATPGYYYLIVTSMSRHRSGNYFSCWIYCPVRGTEAYKWPDLAWCLRSRSAAAGLLWLTVRTSPGHGCLSLVIVYVVQTVWPEESYRCGASLCVI